MTEKLKGIYQGSVLGECPHCGGGIQIKDGALNRAKYAGAAKMGKYSGVIRRGQFYAKRKK